MRMWMVDPSRLCRSHLLGEHKEIHMLAGHVKAGRGLGRYATDALVFPQLAVARHDALVAEFARRGWPSGLRHRTQIDPAAFETVPPVPCTSEIVERNRADLVNRCAACAALEETQ